MIRITQVASIRMIRNLLMERVAKRRLMEHVVPLSLRRQQVARDSFDRYRSSSQSSSGGGYFKRNKRHQRVFNVQTSLNKQVHLQQMAGQWA